MLLPAFVDSINGDQYPEIWSADLAGIESINNGFPVLMWQVNPTSAVPSFKSGNQLMLQNSPNPVRGLTKITFNLTSNERVTIKLYDLKGQEVATITDKSYLQGENEVSFDASDLTVGVYTYRMQYGNKNEVRKMVVL
jgi:flagellar hook assembly protein FlgD